MREQVTEKQMLLKLNKSTALQKKYFPLFIKQAAMINR